MKSLLQILAVLGVFGALVGFVATRASTKPYVPIGHEEAAEAEIAKIKDAVKKRNDPSAAVPIASCDATDFDFGMMDPLNVAEHTFEIRNDGKAPLRIEGGPSSCKCTLSDLKSAVLEPGEVFPVTLTWNSGHAKREFSQVAVVRTNDPLNEELQLKVTGEVRSVLAALPSSVNLQRLIPEAETKAQFVLYSQVWSDMEVLDVSSTNEHITAELSSSPYKGAMAKDDEIGNATSGAVFDVKYDGEAGQGPLGGVLRVRVRPPQAWSDENRKHEEEVADETEEATRIHFPTQDDGTIICEIPFHGNVVRRISLYGKVVDGDGVVTLGKLHPRKTAGANWNLVGRIRGDILPEKIEASVSDIPGLVASVQQIEASKAKNSFSIALELTESLDEAIYTDQNAGMLTIRAEGMPAGDDLLELPVNLTVIKYKL